MPTPALTKPTSYRSGRGHAAFAKVHAHAFVAHALEADSTAWAWHPKVGWRCFILLTLQRVAQPKRTRSNESVKSTAVQKCRAGVNLTPRRRRQRVHITARQPTSSGPATRLRMHSHGECKTTRGCSQFASPPRAAPATPNRSQPKQPMSSALSRHGSSTAQSRRRR